jgi:hypothetical protein
MLSAARGRLTSCRCGERASRRRPPHRPPGQELRLGGWLTGRPEGGIRDRRGGVWRWQDRESESWERELGLPSWGDAAMRGVTRRKRLGDGGQEWDDLVE